MGGGVAGADARRPGGVWAPSPLPRPAPTPLAARSKAAAAPLPRPAPTPLAARPGAAAALAEASCSTPGCPNRAAQLCWQQACRRHCEEAGCPRHQPPEVADLRSRREHGARTPGVGSRQAYKAFRAAR